MFEKLSPHPTPLPNGEGIVEIKTCKHCNISFEITDKDLEFYEKVSPIFEGKKYLIPCPTLCPDCRQQRRLSFRNERKLYKRTCDASGKSIISIYSPDKPYKVYHQDVWWSDKWEPLDYGIDFDFNRNFFEQFNELMLKVPQLSMVYINCENSDYTTFTLNSKNCYMCSGCNNGENALYSQFVLGCTNISDCLMVYNCSECYQGISSNNCYQCFFFYKSENCKKCINIENCEDCYGCLECSNLKNKQFYYKNKFIGREKFEEIYSKYEIKKVKIYNWEQVYIYANIYESENCYGDDIYNSKNCFNCFDTKKSENSKNLYFCPRAIESEDCTYNAPDGVDFCYETCSTVGVSNSLGTFHFWYGDRGYYLFSCNNVRNCFGCVGLKNKEYCILNKQYSKEDYEKIVPKIIEKMQVALEWGEYLPSNISPFGYNETVANEYFPLNKNKILELGFNYSDYEAPFPKVEKIIKAKNLPDDISKIPDDILNWAIECDITKKPFRIIKQELEFYRKHNLPIPKIHPDLRHLERINLRNPRKLFDRKCSKCEKEIKTTYSKDRKEIIYCENCYVKEVY